MKKFLVVIIMLLCLCGCTNAKQVLDQEEHTSTVLQQNLSEDECIESSSEEQEESFFSQPVLTASMDAEQEANQKADSNSSVPTNKSGKDSTTYSSKADAKSAPEQSVIIASVPISTPSPVPTSTPKPKASQSPAPTPSPTPAPQVDIAYWVSYAKSCASSLGLTLNSSAADCWDNPITATSKSTCLERDISSRLSRYAADEDITDVWIWSESIGNGSYNIYIGYA